MGEVTPAYHFADELVFVRLAREIAMDMDDLETILKNFNISTERFETIAKHPRFVTLLQESIREWNSAVNTEQRIKLKAAAQIEHWLPEAHARMHDPKESLSAKVELAKHVSRLASLGVTGATINDPGDKLTITINLGADQQIKLQTELPPKVIDHEPPPTQEQENGV